MKLSSCPGCAQPVDSARCAYCGVAVQAGEWTILAVIGESLHSRMYLAENTAGQRVALKELVFALVPSAREVDAFDREGQLLKALEHPRIPRFIDAFREGSGVHTRCYIAQQFVDGESLLARLQRATLTQVEAIDVARQVLDILDFLHSREPRILHRDIKPANLIVDAEGKLWLVDFGSARWSAAGQTHVATMVGTLGYAPPEQLGGTADRSSDLFALGATLLHLLSGKPPTACLSPDMSLSVDAHLPVEEWFRRGLARLVARDRSRRFMSADEARQWLEQRGQGRRRLRVPGFTFVMWSAAIACLSIVFGALGRSVPSGAASFGPTPAASAASDGSDARPRSSVWRPNDLFVRGRTHADPGSEITLRYDENGVPWILFSAADADKGHLKLAHADGDRLVVEEMADERVIAASMTIPEGGAPIVSWLAVNRDGPPHLFTRQGGVTTELHTGRALRASRHLGLESVGMNAYLLVEDSPFGIRSFRRSGRAWIESAPLPMGQPFEMLARGTTIDASHGEVVVAAHLPRSGETIIGVRHGAKWDVTKPKTWWPCGDHERCDASGSVAAGRYGICVLVWRPNISPALHFTGDSHLENEPLWNIQSWARPEIWYDGYDTLAVATEGDATTDNIGLSHYMSYGLSAARALRTTTPSSSRVAQFSHGWLQSTGEGLAFVACTDKSGSDCWLGLEEKGRTLSGPRFVENFAPVRLRPFRDEQ